MRTITTTTIFFFFVVLLAACTKDVIKNPPPPPPGGGNDTTTTPPNQPPVETGMFRFVANANLAGQPYHSSNLHAVVTIVDDKNQEVVKEKILTLNLDGSVTTQYLSLPVGNYKITRFRMEYGSVHTHFAAPISGSAKASLVQNPLAIGFSVEKAPLKNIPVEVLRVLEGEQPQAYGYPSGAFDHGQSDANPFLKVKIRAIMKIGDVIYDSIPASIRLTTWNDKGEMTTTYGSLSAGVNQVNVLKAAVKYEFIVSKWGTQDAMTLSRQDVNESTVYTLGGSKAAKKLKSERTYRLNAGAELAESKTDYIYDASGKLSKIEYWLRKQDNSPYLAFIDGFEFSAGRVSRIVRRNNETNSIMSSTDFTYDQQGRMLSMSQEENGTTTNAEVTYHPPTQEVKIHYDYSGRGYDMNYYMTFRNGNLVRSSANTSHHNNEVGTYDYDFGINPYRHMGWPDLFLSRSSKNNMTSQYKSYNGSYPVVLPYSFNYKYDADGYPTEVVKHFKSYQTGNFVFSTKTVFVY